MDEWRDDDDESLDDSMHEPVAKRAKRNRDGMITHVDVEAENVKQRLDALKMSDDSSDDEFGVRGDGDTDVASSDVKDAKRMVMNSAKKVKERARRGKMADSVRSLRVLVPGCGDEKKVNQSQVLANTVTYITKVQAQMAQLHREIESLKAQVSNPSSRTDSEIPSPSKGFQFVSTKSSLASTSRQRQSANSRNASAVLPQATSSTTGESPRTSTRPILKLSSSSTVPTQSLTVSRRGQRGGQPIAIDPASPVSPVSPPTAPPTSTNSIPDASSKKPATPLFGAHTTAPAAFSQSPYVPFVPFYSSPNPTMSSSSMKVESPKPTAMSLDATPAPGFAISPLDPAPPPLGTSPLTSGLQPNFLARYTYMGEDLGPEIPAEWQTPSNTVSNNPGTFRDPSGLFMDDIEEVGSWPLYHAHDHPSGQSTLFEPYNGAPQIEETPHPFIHSAQLPRPTIPHPTPSQTKPHQHSKASDLCECGERPVY